MIYARMCVRHWLKIMWAHSSHGLQQHGIRNHRRCRSCLTSGLRMMFLVSWNTHMPVTNVIAAIRGYTCSIDHTHARMGTRAHTHIRRENWSSATSLIIGQPFLCVAGQEKKQVSYLGLHPTSHWLGIKPALIWTSKYICYCVLLLYRHVNDCMSMRESIYRYIRRGQRWYGLRIPGTQVG